MMQLLLFLSSLPLLLLLLFFLVQRGRKTYGEMLLPPGPPGLPFIGNLHQLTRNNSAPHLYLWHLSRTYGSLVTLQFGSKTILVVSSAKMAKEALKTHDLVFAGRPMFLGQKKLSYNGSDVAFSPYNYYWRELRKICVLHLFSLKRVQSFQSIIQQEVSLMIEKITKHPSASKLINLSEMTMLLTSAIVCRIAFGKSYEDESCERSKFHTLLNEAQEVLGRFFIADHFPSMSWIDKLTGQSRRLEKIFKELDLFYQEIIDEHLDEHRAKTGLEDITDVLLHLQKNSTLAIDINFDHIKGVLMNIFIAGTDTSAATLVWTMTELMKNPEAMKKAKEEVRKIVEKKDFVDKTDLQKLPYLKAVVKESFRMHPAAPLLGPHQTTQKCNIDGYEIRPKTTVYVNAWAIGRDPGSWENPDEFFPERFLGSSIDFYGQHFELIPFGAGRRGCPGMHLGVAIVELALANLLYSVDWELPAGMKKEHIDTEVISGLTAHKKNSLCLMAKKYNGYMNVRV